MSCGCKDRKTPGDQRRDDHKAMNVLRALRVRWRFDGETLRPYPDGVHDPAEAVLNRNPK